MRHSSAFRLFANVGVAGSRPSFARRRIAGEARSRARSRSPGFHRPRRGVPSAGRLRGSLRSRSTRVAAHPAGLARV